jgi:glycosyltransferase involved in cell wall biosynthesis
MVSLHVDTARTWRGGQNQVLLTVLGLRAQGHRAVLVAHPDGELARRAGEGHDLIRLTASHEVDLGAGWRLARVFRDLGPDVVHAHDPHAVAMSALALSLMRRPPKPALVAARRVDFHLKNNSFSRWKYRQVDRFIASSDAIRTMLVGDGIPEERVTTVREGVDIERILGLPTSNVQAAFWLPTHVPIIGNIAALVAHKGQKYLIEAVVSVVQKVPEAHLVIFGEGELRQELEHQIHDRSLERHVLLAGFRADVLSLLKGLDLFVMSSVTEGLGTSLLDAMAASKAIVATRAGGIPEVVEHGVTGLLVPPRDSVALADAITRLVTDPALRERMGRAGLARARDLFSAERMVSATLAVYADVVDKPRAADSAGPPPVD